MLRTMAQHPADHKPSSSPPPLLPSPSSAPLSAPPSSSRSAPSSSTPPLFHPSSHPVSPPLHPSLSSPLSKSSPPVFPHPLRPSALPHHPSPPYPSPALPAHPAAHTAHHLSPPAQTKWRVTPLQKDALLTAFHDDPYPELAKKTALADQLGVTTTQISKWFQHRRETLTRLGQFKAQYNRTRRTPEELDVLQNAFDLDRYPTADKLADLEAQLQGVTAKQIKLWFKHRRKQVQKRNRTSSTSPHTSPVLSPAVAVAAAAAAAAGPAGAPSPSPPSAGGPPAPASHHHQHHDSMHSLPLVVPRPQDNRIPAAVISDWQPAATAAALLPTLQNSSSIAQQQQQHHQQQQHQHQQHQQQQHHQQTGLVQPPTSVAYPFAPHSYYAYKTPQMMLSTTTPSTLTDLELMALRGAQAVANGVPSSEALARLATLLNRPVSIVSEWFRAQAVSKAEASSVGDVPNAVYMGGPYVQQTSDAARGAGPNAYQQTTSLGTGQAPNYTSSTGAGSHVQSENGASATPPLAGMVGGDDGGKDATAAQRGAADKQSEGFGASDVMHQVTPNVYPSYVYPAGVVSHGGVSFNATAAAAGPSAHGSAGSAPMLAPLRYLPTASGNVQAYGNASQVWYSQPPSYSKG